MRDSTPADDAKTAEIAVFAYLEFWSGRRDSNPRNANASYDRVRDCDRSGRTRCRCGIRPSRRLENRPRRAGAVKRGLVFCSISQLVSTARGMRYWLGIDYPGEQTLIRRAALFPVLLSMFVAGCTGAPGRDETVGLIGGAVGGFLIGTGIGGVAALAIGTAAGGLVGDRLGHALDERDRASARRAERRAVILGKRAAWYNPASDHRGTVRASGTFTDERGRTCRKFSHVIKIDGHDETGTGIGCRNQNGQWTLRGGPIPPQTSVHASNDR